MACPSNHPLSGSGDIYVGYFDSRAIALAQAAALLQARAEIEAGLAFNGFSCPEKCCKQKSQGPVTATETARDSYLSLLASAFYLEWRYSAKIWFDWRTVATCSNSCPPETAAFEEAFKAAVRQRMTEFGNPVFWFEGWIGNLFSYVGWGEGCAAWAEWIRTWLYQSGWAPRLADIRLCWFWRPLQHQVIVVTLPGGTELVLDPWRDIDNPIWDKDDYERKFGKLTCS